MDRAIGKAAHPVAAVVLDATGPRVLALGRHRGADPINQPFRPGSSVKPLIAYAAAHAAEPALEAGEQVRCGRRFAPNPTLTCFDEHGTLGLSDAIAVSCNIYFYELGRRLGLAGVRAAFSGFGFGKPTGLMAGELSGVVGERGTPEAIATGHGEFEATLLQLAAAYARLGRAIAKSTDPVDREIRAGLVAAVQDPKGTARLAHVPGVELAAKTGTAEAARFGETGRRQQLENGWFVGYAPVSDPAIVVAVVVLEAGSGGKSAAPIAGRILGDVVRK